MIGELKLQENSSVYHFNNNVNTYFLQDRNDRWLRALQIVQHHDHVSVRREAATTSIADIAELKQSRMS